METGEAIQAESGLRPSIKKSLRFWCEHALAPRGLRPARHHLMLIDFLEELAHGEFDRGMVHMPPGYAKTEYVSILFPIWFLANFPDAAIIGGSNTGDLAGEIGRKVRNLVAEHEENLNYSLSPDSKASGRWNTSRGGAYFAVGTEGTAIGRRADLFVIDDPFRSRDQVENPVMRKKVMDWYKATVIGRLKPRARVLLMHTRWHEEDMAGTLIKEMKNGAVQAEGLFRPLDVRFEAMTEAEREQTTARAAKS